MADETGDHKPHTLIFVCFASILKCIKIKLLLSRGDIPVLCLLTGIVRHKVTVKIFGKKSLIVRT